MIKPSDIYPELFHYTTLGGLEGILKSQSLWATHYQDLNDSQEMIYAKQVLKKHVVPYLINQIEQMVKTGVLDKKQIDIESPVGSPDDGTPSGGDGLGFDLSVVFCLQSLEKARALKI